MAKMMLYEQETNKIVDLMQNKDPFFDYLTKKIMNYVPDGGRKQRVLDLGCGGGRNSVAAAKKGYTVVGLDYIEKSLVVARKFAELNGVSDKILFKKEDITKLKAGKYGKFDYIILQEVIEHIKDYQKIIDFAYDSLKVNGVLLITTPHDPKQWNKLDDYARHERRFTIDQLKIALRKFHYSNIQTFGFPFHRGVLTIYSQLLKTTGKSHKAKWFRQINFIHTLYYYLGSALLFIDDHFNNLPFGTTVFAIAKKQ